LLRRATESHLTGEKPNKKETTMKIKLSQTDWEKIGIKMGWMKINETKAAQSLEGKDYDPDRMDMAETPKDLDPSFEEENHDDEGAEFSYLTEGHEDDARMVRLRQMAEYLVEDDDSSEVHVALYWLLSNYHGGQDSPEYAALSSSPYNPGPMEKGPRGSAKFIYDQLEQVFKS
jgi:hypothetical protein